MSPRTRPHSLRIAAAALCLLLAAALPCAAQPAGNPDPVQLQAASCFGDTCEVGWLPVRVRLSNQGESEVRVRVAATWLHFGSEPISEAYSVESVPRQSRRDLHFLVFVPPTMAREGTVRVTARREDGDRREFRVDLPFAVRTARRYLSVSRTPGLMADLPPQDPDPGRPAIVARDAQPDTLPATWIGYERVQMVMLGDCNVQELSEAQRTALVDWVRAGGNLLLSPGPDPLWFENDVVSRLTRIEVAEVGTRKALPNLESTFGPLDAHEPFPFYKYGGGAPTLVLSGEEVVRQYRAGLGSVWVLPFDLGRPPFIGWQGRSRLWNRVTEGIPASPLRESWADADTQLTFGNTQKEVMDPRLEPLGRGLTRLPRMVLLVLVILLYLVVVGPLNYVVLRRLNLHIYTVVTVPLIAIVFVVLIIGLGYLTRGVSTRAQAGSLTVAASGQSPAVTTAYACVFSASPRGYRIDFGEGMAPLPMYPSREIATAMLLRLEQKATPRIEDFNLKLWETGFFQARGFRDLGGPITAVREGNGVALTHGGTVPIGRAILVTTSGQACSEPISLGAGDQARVALAAPAPYSAESLARSLGLEADGFEAAFLGLAVERLAAGRGSGWMLGVLKSDPAPLRVDGAAPSLEHDVALIAVEIETRP